MKAEKGSKVNLKSGNHRIFHKIVYSLTEGQREIEVAVSRGAVGERLIDIVKSPYALSGESGVSLATENLKEGARLWKKLIEITKKEGGNTTDVARAFAQDAEAVTNISRIWNDNRGLVMAAGWFDAFESYAAEAGVRLLRTQGLGWWRVTNEGKAAINRVADFLEKLEISLYLGPIINRGGYKRQRICISDALLCRDPLDFSSVLIHEAVHGILDRNVGHFSELLLYEGYRDSPGMKSSYEAYAAHFAFEEILTHATHAIFTPFMGVRGEKEEKNQDSIRVLQKEVNNLKFVTQILDQYNLEHETFDNGNHGQVKLKAGVTFAQNDAEAFIKLTLGELYFEPSPALKARLRPLLNSGFTDLRDLYKANAALARECVELIAQRIGFLDRDAELAIATLKRSEEIRVELQTKPRPSKEVIKEIVVMLSKISGMSKLLELLPREMFDAVLEEAII